MRTRRGARWGVIVLGVVTGLVLLFLAMPIIAVVGASFNKGYIAKFPPREFGLQGYGDVFRDRLMIQSLLNSFILATLSATVASVLGVAAGIAIAKYRFPGRDAIQVYLLSPIIIPQVLSGVALLQFYTTLGISASMITLFLGHLLVVSPYVVRLALASLTRFDWNLELAARNLGASAFTAFRRVTLPLVVAGAVAGWIFAWILSFDNVTLSIFLTTATVITLPVRIISYLELRLDTYIIAAGALAVLIALGALLIIEWTVGIGRIFGVPERGR